MVISTFVHYDGGISVLATFVQCQWLSASSLVGNRNCRIGNEMKNGTCLCSPLPETGMSWRDVVGSVAQCVIHVFPFMSAVSAFPTIVCHACKWGHGVTVCLLEQQSENSRNDSCRNFHHHFASEQSDGACMCHCQLTMLMHVCVCLAKVVTSSRLSAC